MLVTIRDRLQGGDEIKLLNGGFHETRYLQHRDSVLDCGCPLPLLQCFVFQKRQRTGALQNLTGFFAQFASIIQGSRYY